MAISKYPTRCPNCRRFSYRLEQYSKCSICAKDACLSCMKDYSIDAALSGDAFDKEWEIYHRVCDTFGRVYRLVCIECFNVRTLEILREYPIESIGLLVNATLISIDLIKARLSTG